MDTEKLLKFCLEKGFLLDKETLKLLEGVGDIETTKEFLEKIDIFAKERVITKSFFINNKASIEKAVESLAKDKKRKIEKIFVNLGFKLEVSKSQRFEADADETEFNLPKQNFEKTSGLRVLSSNLLIPRKLEVKDFVGYFNTRFKNYQRIFQGREGLDGLVSIDKLSNGQASIMGFVTDKRITKNKNILLELEDITGRVSVLINKNKKAYESAKDLLLDDFIAVRGSGSKEIFFANELFFPEIFLQNKSYLNEDLSVAFISDIHVGSNNFLEKNFVKFLNWLNGEIGNGEQKKISKKIKYLFMVGDLVDGVGIFPGQDRLLKIKNLKKQYEKLSELLSKLRKDITIVACPGQHDAVRVAEPQPPLINEYTEELQKLDNLVLVSNPAFVEINDNKNGRFRILMYHGQSMAGLINEIESLRFGGGFDNPSKVAKEILKRRHLSPLHGAAIYIPDEREDFLFINEAPDVFATGDLHKADIGLYNNILTIASSCWQSMTPFEEKVGNHPDPCKVPILNLKTREVKILDFSDEK